MTRRDWPVAGVRVCVPADVVTRGVARHSRGVSLSLGRVFFFSPWGGGGGVSNILIGRFSMKQ